MLPRERVRRIPGVAQGLEAHGARIEHDEAADQAVATLSKQLECGVLVSLGGDIATAGATPEGGWMIHVTDDHRDGPEAPGQRISIQSGGLATSSVAARSWRRDGVALHHIIDPSSGRPVRGRWRTVSVAAAYCVDANIATTAALVRDTSALPWLESLGLPARLVDHHGAVHTVGNWPSEEGAYTHETAGVGR